MDEKPKIEVENEEKVTSNLETLVTPLEVNFKYSKNACNFCKTLPFKPAQIKYFPEICETIFKFDRADLCSLKHHQTSKFQLQENN